MARRLIGGGSDNVARGWSLVGFGREIATKRGEKQELAEGGRDRFPRAEYEEGDSQSEGKSICRKGLRPAGPRGLDWDRSENRQIRPSRADRTGWMYFWCGSSAHGLGNGTAGMLRAGPMENGQDRSGRAIRQQEQGVEWVGCSLIELLASPVSGSAGE